MEDDFDYFMIHLKKAITMVDEIYINISIYQLPRKIFRERVYCYELYHQLRKLLGDTYKYMLDGELDKKAHPIIDKEFGPKKPDFVIHYRGEMDYNLAIIEVKSIISIQRNIPKFEKDLEKIKKFINLAKYQYGIMLIYSNGIYALNDNIIESFKKNTKGYSKKVCLIWHPGPHIEPITLK